MLRKDFGDYLEFVQKIQTADAEEMKKFCEERTQMYADKIQDAVAVMPGGDLIFAIAALKMFTEAIQKIDPKATHMAQRLFDGMSYSSKSGTFNANMTEAAARAYADTLKRK